MKKRIITISREFGSGGRFIGEEAAKKLGIDCFFHIQKGVIDLCVRFVTKDTVSEPATSNLSITFP